MHLDSIDSDYCTAQHCLGIRNTICKTLYTPEDRRESSGQSLSVLVPELLNGPIRRWEDHLSNVDDVAPRS